MTGGSYNSERVKLEPLGQSIVEPKSEEEAKFPMIKAAFHPPTFQTISEYYKGKKLPEQSFFANTVSREFEVPKEHSAICVQIFSANIEFLGLVKNLKTGKWLATEVQFGSNKMAEDEDELTEHFSEKSDHKPSIDTIIPTPVPEVKREQEFRRSGSSESNKVFISHGKNRDIVTQLKELLTFGRFVPVVSVERDTTSISVPEKVFQDMRECDAAVIHVMSEGELLDHDGKPIPHINENVLIEIGAAMALYDKKFVLLVQKGVKLPSNLQGLYRCEYEGDKLDYASTMKLLKTFNQFRDEDKPKS